MTSTGHPSNRPQKTNQAGTANHQQVYSWVAPTGNTVPCTEPIGTTAMPIMPTTPRNSSTLPTVPKSWLTAIVDRLTQSGLQIILLLQSPPKHPWPPSTRDTLQYDPKQPHPSTDPRTAILLPTPMQPGVETHPLWLIFIVLGLCHAPTAQPHQWSALPHQSDCTHMDTDLECMEYPQSTPAFTNGSQHRLLQIMQHCSADNIWSPTWPAPWGTSWTHSNWPTHE